MRTTTITSLLLGLTLLAPAPGALAQDDAPGATTTPAVEPTSDPAPASDEALYVIDEPTDEPTDEPLEPPLEEPLPETTPDAPPFEEAPEPPPRESTEEHAAPDDFRESWVTLGLRAGVYVPTIVNHMDPHADLTFEVGVLLPFLDRMLAVVADVSWAPPGRGQELSDPRVGASGGTWSYSMTTHHLMVSGGLLFRFLPPGSLFVPYVSAVGRAYFLETRVDGEGDGEPFGENVESSTQGGFAISVGGELRLGPGALLLDVAFGYSDLPHRITGATSTGSLAIQLGYRLFL